MRNLTLRSARGGFSLTEAVVAIIFVGLGLAGMLASLSSGTRATQGGYELTRASLLAREIREYTFTVPFNDLTNGTYTPCVDGQGYEMVFSDSDNWKQQITVSNRLKDDLQSADPTGTSDVKHVQADILYKDQPALSVGWLVTRR